MRYTPAAIVLILASITFVVAVWLLASELAEGRTGAGVLIAAMLLMVAFVAAAWAVGRIRRIRGLTPEAIIEPPDGPKR